MPLYLGLDCGGSSCRALVLDESEEPVFLAQGGSANLLSTRTATLRRSLERALTGVPKVDAVCACFAGMIGEEQRRQGHALIEEFLGPDKKRPMLIEPDYAAALRACPGGVEVCVIAGTGSIVCSRHDGRLVKSGGGGYLLGDEGSGFQYGRRALSSYLRDVQSVSVGTGQAIFRIFHTSDPVEITARVYDSPAPGALIASLSSSLFRDAEARLPYALEGIRAECQELAGVVLRHIQTYCPQAATVGLAGGVWKKSLVRNAFFDALNQIAQTDIVVVKSEMPPVRGAALLARDFARLHNDVKHKS